MSTLAENVRSEALVEAVRSEVASLETQWSRGMPPTTPSHYAAKVAAAALGTQVSDPQVCRAWRNAWRGSWLPTHDLQHALRCWALMDAAGSVAEQIAALDVWSSDDDRKRAQTDLDAILSDIGAVLLRSARTVVGLIDGASTRTCADLEGQISRVATLHGYLAQVRSGDQPADTLAELVDPRSPSARSA